MITVASTDDVTLAVHDLGGEGRPLLWCHATGFHGRVWRAMAAEFPDRHNLALDFRAYGDSTPPASGRIVWDGFGDDVLAVIDTLQLDQVQVVGHSKGGAAALMAATRNPERFDRIACYEPIVFPGTPEERASAGENPMAAGARRRRTSFDSMEDATANFSAKPPLAVLRDDVLDDYVRFGFRQEADGTVTLKAEPEYEAQTYEMGSRHATFDHLAELGLPVLIGASGDGGMPAQMAPLVAERLPNAELVRFDDLDHFGPLADPPAVAAVIRGFLAR